MLSKYKLLCFVILLWVVYQLHTKCVEGLNQLNSFSNCIDDPDWSVESRDGSIYTCANIGAQISCYDRDISGREGWDRCLASCGNCANVQVTTRPMTNLATFSGDPYEDFGVVLTIDESREFTLGDDEDVLEDSRFVDMDEGYDYEDIQTRVESVEQITDLLTGDYTEFHPIPNVCDIDGIDTNRDDGPTPSHINGYRTCIPYATPTAEGGFNPISYTTEEQLIDNFSDYFSSGVQVYKRNPLGTFEFPPITIDLYSSDENFEGIPDPEGGCDLRDVFHHLYQEPEFVPNKKPYQYEGCYNYDLSVGVLEDTNGTGDCPGGVENCFHTRNSLTNDLNDVFSAVDVGSSIYYYGGEPGSEENLLDRCHYLCSRTDWNTPPDPDNWYSGQNYMGITRGGQCYCLNELPDEDIQNDGAWRCGNNGERCLGQGNCEDNTVSLYSLKHEPINYGDNNDDDKKDICNSLILKDRIDDVLIDILDGEAVDEEAVDEEGDIEEDDLSRLPPVYYTLGDLCPKTCRVV